MLVCASVWTVCIGLVPVVTAGRLLSHGFVLSHWALLGWTGGWRRAAVLWKINRIVGGITLTHIQIWSRSSQQTVQCREKKTPQKYQYTPRQRNNGNSQNSSPSSESTVRVTVLPACLISCTMSLWERSTMHWPLTAEIRSPTWSFPERSVGLPLMIRPILWGITEDGEDYKWIQLHAPQCIQFSHHVQQFI